MCIVSVCVCVRVCMCVCVCIQAKRLEELEKLYREEQVARKRAFNTMEDMKVRACV